MIESLKNKKIAIVGLGIEGLSTAQFLVKKGISVSILDKRKKEDIDQEIVSAASQVATTLILGENYLDGLSEYDVIVRSPGIKLKTVEITNAEKNGAIITSHIKLFFDFCPSPIIGVTGTKGKGTTSSLIYEMLKAAGKDVYIGGNIGNPPLDFFDTLTPQSWVILELSSFQLQDIHKSPHIAVMLMVTSDHLEDFGDRNRHESLEEYIEAKRNILRFQTKNDFAIINRDYIPSNESDIYTDGKVFYVSRERGVQDGCYKKDDALWITRSGGEKKIIDIKDIILPGGHNLENVCAAVMAASIVGVHRQQMVSVLATFKGLEHRLQLVGEVHGVKYYDDSFSTTPETAIAAITAFKSPEIVILGGSSKNSDFSELGKVIRNAKNIRAIIGIGEEWDRIKEEIHKNKGIILLIEGVLSMRQVVQAASKIAKPGDVVLLSPACASFDMFKNYKERGEQFIKEVSTLA